MNGVLRTDTINVDSMTANSQLTAKSILSFNAGILIGDVTPNSINVLKAADFDNNGLNDLVSGDSGGNLYLWRNPGFLLSSTTNWTCYLIGMTIGATWGIDVGDVNKDGYADIVTTDNGKKITLWMNNGTPFKVSWASISLGVTGSVARAVKFADMDNDADLDICTGDVGRDIFIWWNNRSKPPTSPWTSTKVGVGSGEINSIVIWDLDHDDDKDIISGDTGFKITGWRSSGAPWQVWAPYEFGDAGSSDTIMGLEGCDFDNDENLDLVTVDGVGDITVWRNNGLPWNMVWSDYTIDTTAITSFFVQVADFDFDGYMDITSGHDNGTLFVWQNIGTPWGTTWSGFTTTTGVPSLKAGAAADFTGTILPDIIVGSDGHLILFPNKSQSDLPSITLSDIFLLALCILIAGLAIALAILALAWLYRKSTAESRTPQKLINTPRTKTPAEEKPARTPRTKIPADPKEKHP